MKPSGPNRGTDMAQFKRIFEKEFWNTEILLMSREDKKLGLLFMLVLVLLCIAVAGVAAWKLIY